MSNKCRCVIAGWLLPVCADVIPRYGRSRMSILPPCQRAERNYLPIVVLSGFCDMQRK